MFIGWTQAGRIFQLSSVYVSCKVLPNSFCVPCMFGWICSGHLRSMFRVFWVCSVFHSMNILSTVPGMFCLSFCVYPVFSSVYALFSVLCCPVFDSLYVLSSVLCLFYLRFCAVLSSVPCMFCFWFRVYPVFGSVYVLSSVLCLFYLRFRVVLSSVPCIFCLRFRVFSSNDPIIFPLYFCQRFSLCLCLRLNVLSIYCLCLFKFQLVSWFVSPWLMKNVMTCISSQGRTNYIYFF